MTFEEQPQQWNCKRLVKVFDHFAAFDTVLKIRVRQERTYLADNVFPFYHANFYPSDTMIVFQRSDTPGTCFLYCRLTKAPFPTMI
jgi:hypothetical protein